MAGDCIKPGLTASDVQASTPNHEVGRPDFVTPEERKQSNNSSAKPFQLIETLNPETLNPEDELKQTERTLIVQQAANLSDKRDEISVDLSSLGSHLGRSAIKRVELSTLINDIFEEEYHTSNIKKLS